MSNRTYLKQEIQEAHDKFESKLVGPNGFEVFSDYRHWLSVMQHLHGSVGLPAALRLGAEHFLISEKSRIEALKKDLLNNERATHADDTACDSWAWGALYALNGSAIGASLLLKSASAEDNWPKAYLMEMRRFATSGLLSDFFRGLEAARLDRSAARAGALRVFEEGFAHV